MVPRLAHGDHRPSPGSAVAVHDNVG